MLLRIFGLLDILAGLSLIYLSWGHSFLVTFFIVYLILKGLLFFGGFVSIIDIIAGIFMAVASATSFSLLGWFFVIWLIQKGLISLFF